MKDILRKTARTLVAGVAAMSAFTVALAQDQVPVIRFDSVPDPLKLPENIHLGEVTGVAVDSKGHVFVLSRGNTTGPAYAAAAAQLLEFDRNGKFLREIGHNLYAWSFGHSVRIDRDDNIWATDKGSDMVVKFNPQGRVSRWCSAANRRRPTRIPARSSTRSRPCPRSRAGFAR